MTSNAKPAIIDRSEPILGVCEALGDDFGVSPHWFRAALFPLLLWNPLVTACSYAAMAVIVLASRLAFPDERASRIADAQPDASASEEQEIEREPISVLLAA